MASNRVVAVCPVVPFPPVGGGHKRTLRLLEAVDRAGGELLLLTTDDTEPEGVAALRGRGWSVEVLDGPPAKAQARLHQQVTRLPSPYLPEVERRLRELVAEGCAFVQIEHTQSAYYSKALGDIPWVLSLHNVDSELMRSIARSQRPGTLFWLRHWSRWHAMRSVERKSLGAATSVLCVSEEDRRAFEGKAREVVVVPNGVDDELFKVPTPSGDSERVLFFGQLDYPPNAHGLQRFLREGWAAVRAARPGASLRIAGGGASAELSRATERADGAELLGYVDDLAAELATAALTVVPLWAGGGTRLKVLESLAAARPVVGTALGVEAIGFESGRHGVVADTPDALARETVALLRDPARRREFAAEGRSLAEAFRWSRVTEPAEAVYRRLLARPLAASGSERSLPSTSV